MNQKGLKAKGMGKTKKKPRRRGGGVGGAKHEVGF